MSDQTPTINGVAFNVFNSHYLKLTFTNLYIFQSLNLINLFSIKKLYSEYEFIIKSEEENIVVFERVNKKNKQTIYYRYNFDNKTNHLIGNHYEFLYANCFYDKKILEYISVDTVYSSDTIINDFYDDYPKQTIVSCNSSFYEEEYNDETICFNPIES